MYQENEVTANNVNDKNMTEICDIKMILKTTFKKNFIGHFQNIYYQISR